MHVIRGVGVVLGAIVFGGCAAPAQRDAASATSTMVYFASSDPAARRPAGTEFAGPVRWARVDPRFRTSVDELTIDVDNWQRSDRRTADVAPLLIELADAVDTLPRGDRVGPARDTAAVRAVAVELGHGSLDAAGQRRAVRESLLSLQKQLATDANGTYAADPSLETALDEVREAAVAISDSAPDSAVELAMVAARDAMRAFSVSLARGKVNPID